MNTCTANVSEYRKERHDLVSYYERYHLSDNYKTIIATDANGDEYTLNCPMSATDDEIKTLWQDVSCWRII